MGQIVPSLVDKDENEVNEILGKEYKSSHLLFRNKYGPVWVVFSFLDLEEITDLRIVSKDFDEACQFLIEKQLVLFSELRRVFNDTKYPCEMFFERLKPVIKRSVPKNMYRSVDLFAPPLSGERFSKRGDVANLICSLNFQKDEDVAMFRFFFQCTNYSKVFFSEKNIPRRYGRGEIVSNYQENLVKQLQTGVYTLFRSIDDGLDNAGEIEYDDFGLSHTVLAMTQHKMWNGELGTSLLAKMEYYFLTLCDDRLKKLPQSVAGVKVYSICKIFDRIHNNTAYGAGGAGRSFKFKKLKEKVMKRLFPSKIHLGMAKST